MSSSFLLLKDILEHLSPKELNSLKKRLAENMTREETTELKSAQLVNLILNEESISEINALKVIYGQRNHVAFSKLVLRLIDTVDEIYILFNNTDFDMYHERNYNYFYLKRKLLILQMRMLKGISTNLGSQCDKIISLSRKYEFYELVVETLRIKQKNFSVTSEAKLIERIEKEIVRYEEIRNVVERTKNRYTLLMIKIRHANSPAEYRDELEDAITTFESDYERTKSATIGYIYHFIKTEGFQIKRDYKSAERSLIVYLNILRNNASVYTRFRHGDAFANLSINKMYLGEFRKSKFLVEKAQAYFPLNSISYYNIAEVRFYSLYYCGDFKEAERTIEEICNWKNKIIGQSNISRRAYLFACMKTMRNDIKGSDILLDESSQGSNKDKLVWNIARCVLAVINCIEARNFENADLKVKTLQKLLKRSIKISYIRKRDIIIMRILLKLINEGFDFAKVYKQRKRYFDMLESKHPDCEWRAWTPELIVFHEWFKKKLSAA
jgi:hypothetical protein